MAFTGCSNFRPLPTQIKVKDLRSNLRRRYAPLHPVSGTTPGASVNLGRRNKLDFGKNFCALLVNLCVALTSHIVQQLPVALSQHHLHIAETNGDTVYSVFRRKSQ